MSSNSCVWSLRSGREGGTYLIDGVNRRAQPAMHTKNIIVNNGRQAQVIEDLCTVTPDVDAPVLP